MIRFVLRGITSGKKKVRTILTKNLFNTNKESHGEEAHIESDPLSYQKKKREKGRTGGR